MRRDEIKAAASQIAAEEHAVLFPPADWLLGGLDKFQVCDAHHAWDLFEARISRWRKMSFEERRKAHDA